MTRTPAAFNRWRKVLMIYVKEGPKDQRETDATIDDIISRTDQQLALLQRTAEQMANTKGSE